MNLTSTKDLESLKDFYSNYTTKSNTEKNLLFTYYLEYEMELTDITIDHLYTCYETVGAKPPGAFVQGIHDASSKKHWLDTSSLDDIKVTHNGRTHLKHDMLKAEVK